MDEARLEAAVRNYARSNRVAMVVIDYWQAMGRHSRRSEVEEYERAAYHLRDLADEVGAPVLVLSQLTMVRDGQPIAKGSRAIEEVATLVLRLQKDSLYMDKAREAPLLPPVALDMDKRVSRIRRAEAKPAKAVKKDARWD